MNYKKNILIWGTGLKGQRAFDVLTQYENTYNVVAFGDNDKNRLGRFFYNKEIIGAEELCEYNNIDIILLATSAKDSDRKQLQPLVSIPIYDNIENLIFPRVAIDISGFCNAKCKYCVTGRKNRERYNIDGSKYMDFDLFTQIYEHLISKKIIIPETEIMLYNWGEPLINPDYINIIEYLADKKQKYSVSTNASAAPMTQKKKENKKCTAFVMSMPGFSQQSYDKIHRFNFEVIKNNIEKLTKNLYECDFEGDGSISWHIYKFNLNEMEYGRKFAEALNLRFDAYYPYFNGLSMAQEFFSGKMISKQADIENELILDHVNGILEKRPTDYKCFLENILSIDYRGNLVLCCASDEECENFEWMTIFDVSSLGQMMNIRKNMLQCNTCNICREKGYDFWMEKNPKWQV